MPRAALALLWTCSNALLAPPRATVRGTAPRATDCPREFDRNAFERYLDARPAALFKRTAAVASEIVPLQARAGQLWAAGSLRRDDARFARDAAAALERLGPTFIKVGQLLSVREDVVGPVWAAELARLQATVTACSADAPAVVWGANFAKLTRVNATAAACASIAQVHKGTWQSTTGATIEVACKVMRPGVRDAVAVDLCVLLRAGEVLETWAPRVLGRSNVDWKLLLTGLTSALWSELDFVGEGERQETFRRNMGTVENVMVPRVLGATRDVLITEWVDGCTLNELDDRSRQLQRSVEYIRNAYCQSMYVDGYFHADCHGGNLLWTSEDTLCILDCGLMVAMGKDDSLALLSLSLALAARDWPRVVAAAASLGFLPETMDTATRTEAERVVQAIVGPYLDAGGGAKAAASYQASALFRDVAQASTGLPTNLPPSMVLLGRAVLQLEGLALRADPDFKIVDDILPVAARLAAKRSDASSLLRELLYGVAVDGDDVDASKLKALLKSAQQTSTSASSSLGAVLEDETMRSLACDEAVNALDSLGRDLVWRSIGDRGPAALRARAEALVPKLSEDERAIVTRLPETLAALDDDGATIDADAAPLARFTKVPAVRDGARAILRAAIVDNDAASRESLANVADGLTGRLRGRLADENLPAFLAPRLPLPRGWRKTANRCRRFSS